MSNKTTDNMYIKWFLKEWKYLEKQFKNSEIDLRVYQNFKNVIIEILKIWDKQAHSGFTANFFALRIADLIKNVLLMKPFAPIQKGEEEFQKIAIGKTKDDKNRYIYQSKRCAGLFKETATNIPSYEDAIIWKEANSKNPITFTGCVNGIFSRQYIKYPFVPVKFQVLVKYKYHDKNGNAVYQILDKQELYKALCYYIPSTEPARKFKKEYETMKKIFNI